MATLDDILREIVIDVDGALGCAVVDLNSGLLIGVYHSIPYFTHSFMEAAAAVSVDMVRGKTVRAVESLLSTQRGKVIEHSIKEIQVSTDNTFHFLSIIPSKPNNLIIMVTNRQINLGMGWAALRNNLDKIAELCP